MYCNGNEKVILNVNNYPSLKEVNYDKYENNSNFYNVLRNDTVKFIKDRKKNMMISALGKKVLVKNYNLSSYPRSVLFSNRHPNNILKVYDENDEECFYECEEECHSKCNVKKCNEVCYHYNEIKCLNKCDKKCHKDCSDIIFFSKRL